MHQIHITIKPNGDTQVEAKGYQGPSCTDVTRPFIEALGKKVSEKPTEEFFQQGVQQQEVQS